MGNGKRRSDEVGKLGLEGAKGKKNGHTALEKLKKRRKGEGLWKAG